MWWLHERDCVFAQRAEEDNVGEIPGEGISLPLADKEKHTAGRIRNETQPATSLTLF